MESTTPDREFYPPDPEDRNLENPISHAEQREDTQKTPLVADRLSKVPRCASELKIQELPQQIPITTILNEKEWFTNTLIYQYITYLATQDSQIAVFWSPGIYEIDTLHKTLFEDFPREIKNFKNLNVPIYLHVSKNHWGLVYVDRKIRTVEYYDSKKNYGNYDAIVKELTNIAHSLSEQEPLERPYKFILKINKVLQPDGYQCGAWVLFFLEYRLTDPEFDFNILDINESQELIKKYRTKIKLKISEMTHLIRVNRDKELPSYEKCYHDHQKANDMLRNDRKITPYLERLKLYLNGKWLVPKGDSSFCKDSPCTP